MTRQKKLALFLSITGIFAMMLACASTGIAPEAAPAAPGSAPQSTVYLERSAAEAPAAEAPAAAEPDAFSTGGTAAINDEPYDATFFENYGVNPIIDTVDDHFSTFAMDVDTASYTVARRFISDGYLPDPASVRVEEFVNYFNYLYESPGDDAFSIQLAGAPAPFGYEDYYLMQVGLQGKVIGAEARKDATLIFVIDVSGSMDQENRLGLVKQALRLLVDQLRPTDEVGIVIYGSQGQVILEPTSAANTDLILGAIERLQPGGSTNAEEGLKLGYRLAVQGLQPGRISRLVLCSDGVANVGNTGPDSILEQVRGYVADGITLSTVGFGMGNYNDVLMEQLANDGDGNYAYVDTLAEARRIFVENLTGTLQVIAKDAKIQVDFNPEAVSRYRLLGYENRAVADEQFRDDSVDAGEVGGGHSVTALYEVKFQDEVAPEAVAATVFIRYQDPDSGEVTELNRSITRGEFRETFEEMPARFKLAAAAAEYAELLRGSYWAQEGSLAQVRELAQQISAALPDDPEITEFVYLVSQAEQLTENR